MLLEVSVVVDEKDVWHKILLNVLGFTETESLNTSSESASKYDKIIL